MAVLIKNSDITIYNRYYDKTNALDKYQRINIDGVNLKSKRNATVSDKGINVFYTTVIIVPKGDYTFTTEDRVVKGHIESDITRLKELEHYKPMVIVGIQENNLFNTITIECK